MQRSNLKDEQTGGISCDLILFLIRNKVYLDRPEIIRRKAKKLVAELEKRHIKLTEASIEK